MVIIMTMITAMMEDGKILDILQTVLAAIACVLAWIIPKRIMWEQTYSSLINDYRRYDFAVAVQGIVEFFSLECQKNVARIASEYERRFLKDIYGLQNTQIKNLGSWWQQDAISSFNKKAPEACLHYQRSLLAQFFYQLDLCARSIFIGKKRVKKDFTQGEANLIRILFLIDQAIDESDILKKDISCDVRIPRRARTRGMNKYLSHLYSVLRKSKPYMEE
ncbi:MAG: hypothetical protein ACTTKL_05395 [Treponema sp.]